MSDVRAVAPIQTEVTEPDMYGGYQQRTVDKWSFACLGCGLVWPMRWHAVECEKRGHVVQWVQRYPKGPFINGQPQFGWTEYPRHALRRVRFKS